MSTSTKILQKQFLDFIYRNENLETLSQNIDSTSPYEVMQIHRKHVWSSLMSTLKIHYKSVLTLLGEELFLEFAQSYILENPSTTPDLELYGFDFPDFLRKNSTLPYIRDIAVLDIAHARSSIAPDYQQNSISEFQSIKPQDYEKIIFYPNPTNIICKLEYDIMDLFQNIDSHKQSDVIVRKENLMIVSRNIQHQVRYSSLSSSEERFLNLCAQQKRFFNIFKEMCALDKNFDLQTTLLKLIENQLIARFSIT